MVRHVIERVYLPDRTLSTWYNERGEACAKVLELKWDGNKRSTSCILPAPTDKPRVYIVTKEAPIPPNDPLGRKERPYWHFRIHNVPGRSGILVHRGVKPEHSKGCLLVGSRWADENSEQPILESSGVKLQWMVDNFPDKFELEIRKK